MDTLPADAPADPPSLAAISPVLGTVNGGTTVIVQGSGFQAGAVIAIGGIPCAPVVVASATQLTCTTGDSNFVEGAMDVVVTNPDAAAATSTGRVHLRVSVDDERGPPELRCRAAPAGVRVAGGRVVGHAASREWIILVFHKLVTAPTLSTEWGTADFAAMVDHIAATGIPVKTVGQVLAP